MKSVGFIVGLIGLILGLILGACIRVWAYAIK